MILHLRAYEVFRCTIAGVALAALMVLFGANLVPLPFNDEFKAPISYLLPAAIGILLGYTSYTDDVLHVATSTRHVALVTAARAGIQVLATTAPCALAAWLVAGRPDLWVGTRNILLLTGASMVAARVVSAGWFWFPSVAYMLLVFTAGVGPGNQPWPWALPLHTLDSQTAAAISGCSIGLGIVTMTVTSRRAGFFL